VSAKAIRALSDPGKSTLWEITLMISAFGVFLIVRAIKG
jgi:hypothetical protein